MPSYIIPECIPAQIQAVGAAWASFCRCENTVKTHLSRPSARSYTAATFVTYFAQRLSSACVMYSAESLLRALKKARGDRLRDATT